ncbi:MAG: hypothetical protein ABSB35_06845 [Bryobacteraceae bacterium]
MRKKIKQFVFGPEQPTQIVPPSPSYQRLSPDLQREIIEDAAAGRVYTIKEIQALMRCSYATARERVMKEPGVILYGDPRIPHCVFRNMIIRYTRGARLNPVVAS